MVGGVNSVSFIIRTARAERPCRSRAARERFVGGRTESAWLPRAGEERRFARHAGIKKTSARFRIARADAWSSAPRCGMRGGRTATDQSLAVKTIRRNLGSTNAVCRAEHGRRVGHSHPLVSPTVPRAIGRPEHSQAAWNLAPRSSSSQAAGAIPIARSRREWGASTRAIGRPCHRARRRGTRRESQLFDMIYPACCEWRRTGPHAAVAFAASGSTP